MTEKWSLQPFRLTARPSPWRSPDVNEIWTMGAGGEEPHKVAAFDKDEEVKGLTCPRVGIDLAMFAHVAITTSMTPASGHAI